MELQRTLDNLLKWMHRYVSPVFLALLVASFILWYIAKLSYTYTTEQVVRVSVDGEPFEVTCVVEGVGTNLFGYRVYMNKTLRIPLSELKYKRSREEGHEGKVVIDPQSLQSYKYRSRSGIQSPKKTSSLHIAFQTGLKNKTIRCNTVSQETFSIPCFLTYFSHRFFI